MQTFNPNNPWILSDKLQNLTVKLVFFFIWPFGSWIYALKTANTRSSYVIFFLFSMLLCWHMSPTNLSNSYDDFLGIMERFINAHITTPAIKTEIYAFFHRTHDAPKELYEDLLIWFVKEFISDNYHFFFLLAAIPVAYCQLKCLQKITLDSRFQTGTFLALVVIFLFIFPRDIITVQNPRFATGFWICTMSTIYYYCNNKPWLYILPILISPFFHSAMWLYVFIFFISIIIPKNYKLLTTFALISIPFSFYNAELLQNLDFNFNFIPPSIQNWANRHLSDEAYNKFILHEGASGFWWVTAIFDIFMKLVYIYMTLIMIKEKDSIAANEEVKRLFPFYLIIFMITNIIQFIPVLGERYFWFVRVFCIFMWYKAFYPEKQKTVYVLLIACSFAIIKRYGYILGGALSVNTPLDIFVTPLPYLMGKGILW